jgi:hypothetical protein
VKKRPDDSPFSSPTETEEIDDLWADVAPERPRRNVLPMDSDPFGLDRPTPSHTTPASRRSSSPVERVASARTTPEPVVRRHVEQMETRAVDRQDPPKIRLRSLELEDSATGGSAMDLVESGLPPIRDAGVGSTNTSDMQDRYAVGDFTGALVLAESILETNPDDEDAKRYANSCREVLTQMYAARLGPMDQIAKIAIPADQITWLSLDHRAGFLLSLVDGCSTIEEILDISGMSRLEALRIVYTLVQQNVVSVG